MTDIKELTIQGSVVTPSSPAYEKAISRMSATSVLHPAYVTYPASPSDVPVIIRFGLSQKPPLEISVKGGGCNTSTASSSEGGIVIDLSRLNLVKVADDKQSVSVQGGALWGDVYSEVERHDLLVVGGNVWSVGVGGFLTGGGYSNLSGQYGLAVDNMLSATVVLADGRIVKSSKDEEADLFWAIRGGGNQFGVVTEFILKAYPAHGPALVGALGYPGTELPEVLKVVRDFLTIQTPKARIMLCFARAPPDFHPGLMILPYIEGDTKEAENLLSPFRTRVKPVFEQTGFAPNFSAVAHGSDAFLANSPPRSIAGGAFFSELWEDVVMRVFGEWASFTEDEDRKASIALWEFDFKDKVAEVDRAETAFPLREPHYYLIITGRHYTPATDTVTREWISKMTSYIKETNTERTGMKLATPANFAVGNEDVQEVYGENLGRLRKLKAKYDPKMVWSKGWAIQPDFD